MLKTVLTDTLEIAFEEAGDPAGGPVILLHGFPDDAKAWAAAARGLSSAGFYTVAPYLRGFGKTRFRHAETPRSGQQAALAADLRDLIAVLNLQQPILVGYDWGARAACIERQLIGQPLIEVPTIVLHGEGDGVHPPERSEGQEKLFPRYHERWLIPEAGHLFPRESPDAVIAAVQKLARLIQQQK
jgi:pimeloyl-ACP methyl ester carboxylesterase